MILSSCSSLKNMNYYEETKNLLNDTNFYCCLKRFENNYWIEEIEYQFKQKTFSYLDSLKSYDFDDVIAIEDSITNLSVHQSFLKIDYRKVLHDLKISERRKMENNAECDCNEKVILSIPIFNNTQNKAIVESNERTYLFKKNDSNIWEYYGPGITISY